MKPFRLTYYESYDVVRVVVGEGLVAYLVVSLVVWIYRAVFEIWGKRSTVFATAGSGFFEAAIIA